LQPRFDRFNPIPTDLPIRRTEFEILGLHQNKFVEVFRLASPNETATGTVAQSMQRLSQIKKHLTHKPTIMKHKVAVIGSGNW